MKTPTILLTALVPVLWGFLIAKPQYAGMQTAQASRLQAQQTLESDTALVATLGAEQRRAAQLHLREADLNATLPAREDLSALLRDLRVMADARKVNLAMITRTAISSPLPGISAITLNLSSVGKYPDLQRFLNDLHDTSRAITTDSGNFTVGTAGVTSSLKIITYARNLPITPAASTTGTPGTPGTGTPILTPTGSSDPTPTGITVTHTSGGS